MDAAHLDDTSINTIRFLSADAVPEGEFGPSGTAHGMPCWELFEEQSTIAPPCSRLPSAGGSACEKRGVSEHED